MLIDIHTHVFPDKIAPGAVNLLKSKAAELGKYETSNHTDGTLSGLKRSMTENGVDTSVVQPVVTRPQQFESINRFAEEISRDGIISFAGIHPECDNTDKLLDEIKAHGFPGIKLHPEYQQCDIDRDKSLRILEKAEKLGLYTLIHCGIDVGINPPVHCSPKQLRNTLSYVSGKYIIAAHLGGFDMWDDVEKYLVGTDVYMDTAAVSGIISNDQMKRIITNHGSEKILFGSDSPWECPKDVLNKIMSLGLSQEALDNITHKNAIRILKTASQNRTEVKR